MCHMKGISAFFYNYDVAIIVLCAVVNACVFGFTIYQIRQSAKTLYPKSSLRYKTKVNSDISAETAIILSKKKSMLLVLYSTYANLTAIFPLLGILGTVAALIMLSPNGGSDMMENLMVALGTTLLGAIFAVLFKILDSLLTGPIEVICDDVDYVLRNYDGTGEEE